MRFLVPAFFSLFVFSILPAAAQQVFLINKGSGSWRCPLRLYRDIESPAVLHIKGREADRSKAWLSADSIDIKRKNDSIFLLTPRTKNDAAGIQVHYADTVFTETVQVAPLYFNFHITERDPVHSMAPWRVVVDEMSSLHVSDHGTCYDPTRAYSLVRYSLGLKRVDTVLFTQDFVAHDQISPGFKERLKKIYRTGDTIFAPYIVLRAPSGELLTYKDKFLFCAFGPHFLLYPDDPRISYAGRVKIAHDTVRMYWPGSSATIRFKGTELAADIDARHEQAYFYAIIDGDALHARKLLVDTLGRRTILASKLRDTIHQVVLFKLSNNTSENLISSFRGFGSEVLSPKPLPSRKIEFYGNSITVGHGVDRPDSLKDSGKPEHFNNYYSYAAITARHFQAQYSCIARSGIGITVSWFPEIMPEIYDRLDPFDSASKWDFSRYHPDLIVVNLFQNDSWLVNRPEHPQFKARFGDTPPTPDFIISAYRSFIQSLRQHHPDAQIICALGSMDATKAGSPWPGYIQQAVTNLHDKKIHTFFFPYKNTTGHPNRQEQQAMADLLIAEIHRIMGWE